MNSPNRSKLILLPIVLSAILWGGIGASAAVVEDPGDYVPVAPADNIHPSYITEMKLQQDRLYLTADYIQWFEGEEADRVFLEEEPDSGLAGSPNGYYILNENPRLRTIEVDPQASVFMQVYSPTGDAGDIELRWNQELSLEQFVGAAAQQELLLEYPYHLVVEGGRVVKIIQQYIP